MAIHRHKKLVMKRLELVERETAIRLGNLRSWRPATVSSITARSLVCPRRCGVLPASRRLRWVAAGPAAVGETKPGE